METILFPSHRQVIYRDYHRSSLISSAISRGTGLRFHAQNIKIMEINFAAVIKSKGGKIYAIS
jgi:hypothetical protein